MIKVLVAKKDNVINEITINGHACYDEYGKDIVCAAVSTLVITTINNIIALDEAAIKYVCDDNETNIKVIKENDITIKLLSNMINSLISLENEYPKNIKVTM